MNRFKIALVGLLTCVLLCTPVATFAAQINSSGGEVKIEASDDNVFVTANHIIVEDQEFQRDLTLIADKVEIKNTSARSIHVIARTVVVTDTEVKGSAYIAAGNADLNGVFKEDIVVAAWQLAFRDSQVFSDVLMAGVNTSFENTTIRGDVYGSYSVLNGDLDKQVRGNLNVTQSENPQYIGEGFVTYITGTYELSILFGLVIVILVLRKKKELEWDTVGLNIQTGLDAIAGLCYIVFPFIFFVISLLLQVYPLVVGISILLYTLFLLSAITLPIYIASGLRSIRFLRSVPTIPVIFAVYVLIVILNVLSRSVPALELLNVPLFALSIANYGFIMRRLLRAINESINTVDEPI